MKKVHNEKNKIAFFLYKVSITLLFMFFFMVILSCDNNPIDTQVTSEIVTQDPELNEIYNTFKNSIFRLDIINNQNMTVKQGTGFILNEEGFFITNAHVLEDGWRAIARFDGNNQKYYVEGILYFDDYNDIAIGKVDIYDDFDIKPVEFSEDYQVNDVVYSIGYPNYAPEALVTTGNIISTYYTSDIYHMLYIKTDSLIKNGNSGGILATETGKVIGITSVGFSDETFGSIRSVEFSSWEEYQLEDIITLSDYFHPYDEIELTNANFNDYFVIEVKEANFRYDLEHANLILDYELNIYPKSYLEIKGINEAIFVALNVEIDYEYQYYNNEKVYENQTEIFFSINLNRIRLKQKFIGSQIVRHDIDSIIGSIDKSHSFVYVEGVVFIYK